MAWIKSLSPAHKTAIAELLRDTPQGARFVHLCYQAVLPTADERNEHTRNTEGAELARQAIDWLTRKD
jgi:hypothetical protein